MSRSRVRGLFGALLLVAFPAGCSGGGDEASTLDLGIDQAGESIDLSVGQHVDVTLQSIGPRSYGSPVLSSSAVSFVGVSSPGAPNPGGPLQAFEFRAVAAGVATLEIPRVPEGEAFTLTFNVRE